MTWMKKTVFAVGSIALLAPAAIAAKSADVITARQAVYKQIAKLNKLIGDELRNPAPDLAVIRANAKSLASVAPRVPRWYPKGSGAEAGVKTEALPAIWEQPAEFRAKAAAFATATRVLQKAAAGTDVTAIQTAAKAVGGTCKGCHDSFRARR